MANEVVPETTWGPRSFGLADARIVTVQRRYATEQLHFPVWGTLPVEHGRRQRRLRDLRCRGCDVPARPAVWLSAPTVRSRRQ